MALLAAATALGGCGSEEATQSDRPERAPDAQERAMLDDAASMLDEDAAEPLPPDATATPEGPR